jgi:hypothetical protein
MDPKEAFKEIQDKLHSIDITLAKQHMTLEDHTRRSLANEKAVEVLGDALKPITKHVNMMEGALKLIGVMSLVATFVFTVVKLFTA